MKKLISLLLAAVLFTAAIPVCGADSAPEQEEAGALRVVTTIFPVFDWVRNVLGDNPGGVEAILLLDSGVDLHSYQPTADDIMTISTSDLFIYVGGESDAWVEDALREAANDKMIALNLLDALGDSAKKEALLPGMQEDHDHDHAEDEEHDHAEDEEHDHEDGALDEHIWLSLRNASVLTGSIADALGTLDPEHADTYAVNADAYREKLAELDARYEETVSAAPVKTLLFGDRFPFAYLADDYGLTCYAAFPGCSAETEASFETIIFLAQKVDELSLHTVMTIEGSDRRIAETIAQNTKSGSQMILSLDSMQSETLGDVLEGTTYLSVMEKNLSVIKEALQ